MMSVVSMALHQEGISTHIRIFQLRRNDKGTLAGRSTPFALVGQLLHYRDTILRAARTVDPAIVNITANETWKRLKIHGIPLERYLGKGTFRLNKLRAEIESENEGVEIPMEMRWLDRVPDIKQQFRNTEVRGASVTFVVHGQQMADRIIEQGLRVLREALPGRGFYRGSSRLNLRSMQRMETWRTQLCLPPNAKVCPMCPTAPNGRPYMHSRGVQGSQGSSLHPPHCKVPQLQWPT